VLYGHFTSQPAAVKAKETLDNEGIRNFGVTASAIPGVVAGVELFSVYEGEYNYQAEADLHKSKLTAAGYSPVLVSRVGRFYQVYVGAYNLNDASTCLGQLKQQGNTVAKVVKAPFAMTPSAGLPAGQSPGGELAPQPATAPELVAAPATVPDIVNTPAWKNLSDDQKSKVLRTNLMQIQLRRGNPLAQQLIDVDKRLENLDQAVQNMVKDLGDKETRAEKKRQEINEKISLAENEIHAEQYNDAIGHLREALHLDETNEFLQRPYIQRRISYCESRLRGETYEGQSGDIEKQYKAMQERASSLSTSGELSELELAQNRSAGASRISAVRKDSARPIPKRNSFGSTSACPRSPRSCWSCFSWSTCAGASATWS
jgi:hypothetical protein